MSTLKITRGLPASGKTTWAKEWVAEDPHGRVRINRDDLRHLHFGKYEGLTREQEQRITTIETEAARATLRLGLDVVIDAMHLRPRYVRAWQRLAHEAGAEFEVKEFEISIEESIQRNLTRSIMRERWVSVPAIQGMAKWLNSDGSLRAVQPWAPEPRDESPTAPEPYVPDHSKPKAIIVDLDGTIALHTSGRSPYDMTRVLEDSPNWPVIKVVAAMQAKGYEVVFMSAREDTARLDTMRWLEGYFPIHSWTPLFMRTAGDHRKDAIVKAELFDKHVRHEYDVEFALDDRNQVVDMWRSMGLACFQVAPGAF